MKKILFIVTKSENGGAQKWIKEQMEILRDQYELFLVSDEEGWLVKNTQSDDVLISQDIYKRFSLSFFLKFLEFVKLNEVDLIIASSANAGIYARLIKFFYNCKVVYVSHGWSSIYNGGKLTKVYTFIEKQLSKLTDSILCISVSDYQRAKSFIKINENKLKLLPNKIFPMQSKSKRNSGNLKLLTVSRLRYPKRVDLLIESLIDLNIDLYIVGNGPLMKEMNKYKAKNNIYFLGEIDGFSDFKDYDIFALISESEGLPLSAIEAMSAGLPLILSDVGGCSELINGNGTLVNNEKDSIIRGVSDCIENYDVYSQKSIELFNQKYNLVNYKHIYFRYYKEVMN
ncbi:MAG: glycosyltransferase [Campylobacterales bacterium]|nr:glycosyltransferase [Campylobacterales bacterium]